jgi:alpha-amylase
MKKLKGILSIFMVLALLCSTFAFAMSVQAADTAKSKTELEPKLQDDVSNGVILHALCWSYSAIEKNIPAIAAAGYSAVQVSPVQQPKDVSSSTNVSGQWWKLYQPVSLSLAQESWSGTPEQLKSLCTTAHKNNVKIICDVVTNHLGATSDKSLSQTPWLKLADEVKTYESTLWNGNGAVENNPYFHNPSGQANDSDARSVTQLVSSKCPDLNTGNTTVQNKVISLLKQCIDAGADGFRFDAAKHIETPSDSSISPNNYWTNVINGANSYAQGKGKTLFYYGEVLNTPGGGRSISGYTNLNSGKYRVTNNKFGNGIRNAIVGKNVSGAAPTSYPSELGGAKNVVTWAESHDTYLNVDDSGNSNGVSNEDILKTWAMVASRKDSTPLFFARTNEMKMGQAATNTSYKSVAAAEVNKFHNNFVGQSEKVGTSGNFAYVARGTSGVVIVNVKGTSGSASVSGTGLANGEYKDMITGAKFTVSGGTVSGNIGSTGIAVVVQSSVTPMAFADQESKTFQSDTITIGLSLSNATSGTYQLDDYTPVKFTGSPKIRIGSDYKAGDTIKLTLTATDGSKTTSNVYEYTKAEAASSGVYIIFPASVISQNKWKTPVFAYIYDETTGNGTKVGGQVYKNAAWPGEELEYDSKLDAYYLEVNSKECRAEKTIKVQNGVAETASGVRSDFNLATSANTRVILSDSTQTTEGGKQYPLRGAKKPITLAGKTHKLVALNEAGWQVSTEVPGQSTTPVAATEVTKGNAVEPTTQPATTAPPVVSGMIYGDVNGDKAVTIKDATLIQKHSALIEMIAEERQVLGDVNTDKNINVKDATAVQKYLAQLSGSFKVGEPYTG